MNQLPAHSGSTLRSPEDGSQPVPALPRVGLTRRNLLVNEFHGDKAGSAGSHPVGQMSLSPEGEVIPPYAWRRRASGRRMQPCPKQGDSRQEHQPYKPIYASPCIQDKAPIFEQTDEALMGRWLPVIGERALWRWQALLLAGCALAVLMAGSASAVMWGSTTVIERQRAEWKAEAGSPERRIMAEVKRNASLVPAARKLVADFFAAGTPQEKQHLVRGGQAMLPAMEAWYARHPDEPAGFKPSAQAEFGCHQGQDFVFIHGRLRDGTPVETVVEIAPGGLRLDWRFLTGAGEMEWADWREQQPPHPVLMRVEASLDDYFAAPFDDPTDWFCVKITDISDGSPVWAYVARTSDEGMTVWRQLNERKGPVRLMGTFEFPAHPSAGSRHAPQVHFRSLATEGWLDRNDDATALRATLSTATNGQTH